MKLKVPTKKNQTNTLINNTENFNVEASSSVYYDHQLN